MGLPLPEAMVLSEVEAGATLECRLLWQPGILISKERRLGQEAPFASGDGGYSSVTQPSDAFFTLLMYLYNVPRTAL